MPFSGITPIRTRNNLLQNYTGFLRSVNKSARNRNENHVFETRAVLLGLLQTPPVFLAVPLSSLYKRDMMTWWRGKKEVCFTASDSGSGVCIYVYVCARAWGEGVCSKDELPSERRHKAGGRGRGACQAPWCVRSLPVMWRPWGKCGKIKRPWKSRVCCAWVPKRRWEDAAGSRATPGPEKEKVQRD